MSSNKKIIHVLTILTALFLSLMVYLTYFQLFKAPKLAASGQNPRTALREQSIKRGDIVSADGEKLAYSEFEGEKQIRNYPYGSLYAHVLGYSSQTYGKSMLENTYNGYIMGTAFSNRIYNIKQYISGEGKEGANLTLTIDHRLQKKARELMGDRNGAVVALNPKTGATLALYSNPSYDTNEKSLKENWSSLAESGDSVFLARATSGLYAPGSVFKTVTAAAAVENGLEDMNFNDTGSVFVDSHEFKNFGGKKYGNIDIYKGFAVSSNVVFVTLADKLGYSKLSGAAKKFMIGEKIDYDIPLQTGQVLRDNKKTNVAAVGMGQGDLLVTPMNMALVASAVANEGKMMAPYIVESADLSNGYNVYAHKSAVLSEATDKDTAKKVAEMMKKCVKSGTGTSAAVSGIEVAGKTGTAENTGEDHAWFIAFAPADDPQIAVCVMMENAAKTGGQACGPVVRGIISAWNDTKKQKESSYENRGNN